MKTYSSSRLQRDRNAGVFCYAHVRRGQPAAALSSFTSLRRTPHCPDPDTPAQIFGLKAQVYLAWGDGWPIQRGKGGGPSAAWSGGHEQNRLPSGPGATFAQAGEFMR